jgi:hypothetical protein
MGLGGNEKLPSRGIPTVGIVWKVVSTPTQPSHKHHHHGGAVWYGASLGGPFCDTYPHLRVILSYLSTYDE